MENTINDLYYKYTNEVGQALEEDRYFQYLYEMVQAGENTLLQNNRVLHKVVDEKWLSVVEDSLESIFNIIDKPRRFIATTEEVVPVALAKKITADSVRHLSMNTQFISSNAAGEIQPTKILNVTTEESYDLYENRFVYHLIQRLFSFVDKRTDIIFWSTGDEICNTMSMESKVDDAYEEISYKIEMTIKNRQSFAENDNDNMDVFKRIDRVRRMARALRTSSFCDIMAGCAMVRSPIQRTNLMMKDPDYRACYKLWQFIENYDEVGYTIEERDTALEFDEEYLIQMYTNLITNYTVFKSLLESDPRKMTEIAQKKREPVKPKFKKEIKEEIVDDYDIPDVEIRKVIIEEVTQAQLDAEAKLKEETEKREELEKNLDDLNWQMDAMNQQMEYLQDMKDQMEESLAQLQQQLETEKAARKQKELELAEAQESAEKKLAETQESAEKKLAEAQESAEKKLAEAQESAEKKLAEAQESAELELAEAQKSAEKKLAEAQKSAEKKLAEMKKSSERNLTKAKKTEEQLRTAQEELMTEKSAKEQIESEAAKIRMELDRNRTNLEEAAQKILTVEAQAKEAVATAQKARKQAEEKLSKAEKEREKALAKAEANSLSRYIKEALQERKEKKNQKED